MLVPLERPNFSVRFADDLNFWKKMEDAIDELARYTLPMVYKRNRGWLKLKDSDRLQKAAGSGKWAKVEDFAWAIAPAYQAVKECDKYCKARLEAIKNNENPPVLTSQIKQAFEKLGKLKLVEEVIPILEAAEQKAAQTSEFYNAGYTDEFVSDIKDLKIWLNALKECSKVNQWK